MNKIFILCFDKDYKDIDSFLLLNKWQGDKEVHVFMSQKNDGFEEAAMFVYRILHHNGLENHAHRIICLFNLKAGTADKVDYQMTSRAKDLFAKITQYVSPALFKLWAKQLVFVDSRQQAHTELSKHSLPIELQESIAADADEASGINSVKIEYQNTEFFRLVPAQTNLEKFRYLISTACARLITRTVDPSRINEKVLKITIAADVSESAAHLNDFLSLAATAQKAALKRLEQQGGTFAIYNTDNIAGDITVSNNNRFIYPQIPWFWSTSATTPDTPFARWVEESFSTIKKFEKELTGKLFDRLSELKVVAPKPEELVQWQVKEDNLLLNRLEDAKKKDLTIGRENGDAEELTKAALTKSKTLLELKDIFTQHAQSGRQGLNQLSSPMLEWEQFCSTQNNEKEALLELIRRLPVLGWLLVYFSIASVFGLIVSAVGNLNQFENFQSTGWVWFVVFNLLAALVTGAIIGFHRRKIRIKCESIAVNSAGFCNLLVNFTKEHYRYFAGIIKARYFLRNVNIIENAIAGYAGQRLQHKYYQDIILQKTEKLLRIGVGKVSISLCANTDVSGFRVDRPEQENPALHVPVDVLKLIMNMVKITNDDFY